MNVLLRVKIFFYQEGLLGVKRFINLSWKELAKLLKFGTIVGAICGATEALANRGYLDTRKHTTNNLEYTKMVCPNRTIA